MSPRPSKRVTATSQAANDAWTLHDKGDFAGACRAFERILEQEPDNPFAQWGVGRALLKLKHYHRALPFLEKAVQASPEQAEPHFDLALAYLPVQRADAAVNHLRIAVGRQPKWVEAWCLLGFAEHSLGRAKEAEASLRRALAIKPDHAETFNHLGLVAMRAPGRLEEAQRHFLQAISLRPSLIEAWNNLGTELMKQNRLDESLAAYRRATAIDPKFSKCKFNESLVQLLRGNLCREAWLKYEYRWVVLQESPQRGFRQPLWRGESIAGQTILLHSEQGLGDTLQMVRYAPVIAALGATVILEVQPVLKALLAGLPGVTTLLSAGDPLPAFDYQCPLLSVPFALDTRIDTIPSTAPYVRAPAERIHQWAGSLPPHQGCRVGVVWRGNPKHHNDANRSVRFETFRQLFDGSPCQFVGLQFGLNEVESATFATHPACALPSGTIKDFADTAALVAHLDLVVTVDTSVAHLAGAMGKEVWMLLPFAPDWRWMLRRTDSPWYPTMRLFRQPAIGDWDSVIAAVSAELRKRAFRRDSQDVPHLKSA